MVLVEDVVFVDEVDVLVIVLDVNVLEDVVDVIVVVRDVFDLMIVVIIFQISLTTKILIQKRILSKNNFGSKTMLIQ